MAEAADVIAYVDWVDSLLWREAHRCDPIVSWQRDMSYDEIAACAGVEAPLLAPGDLPLDVNLGIELYWPRPLLEKASEDGLRVNDRSR